MQNTVFTSQIWIFTQTELSLEQLLSPVAPPSLFSSFPYSGVLDSFWKDKLKLELKNNNHYILLIIMGKIYVCNS